MCARNKIALGIFTAVLALRFAVTPLSAAIIGTNVSALPLSADRVATLPKEVRHDWMQYLKRSDDQRRTDQTFLQKEMRHHHVRQVSSPPEARFNRLLPLNRPADWYGTPDAWRIADVVISFQTPAGGWSKNLNMTGQTRAAGMLFASDNRSRFPVNADFDAPPTNGWNYVGTFDNDATIMQLRFLSKVIAASDAKPGAPYRAAFLRGLDYIFHSQYPNGGWPQVWPLQGGYHDAITYNDGAIVNILSLLRDVSGPTNLFDFVPHKTREKAGVALNRGIACLLESQISVEGRRVAWCQQHDAVTLQPTSARNYEMPSLASGESAGILLFLMQLPNPDETMKAAIRGGAEWFEKTGIRDVAFRLSGDQGRELVPAPGNGPIWARYYEIGSNRPIFGERDKTIHDTLSEISKERRNGYSWYVDVGKRVLQRYAEWNATR